MIVMRHLLRVCLTLVALFTSHGLSSSSGPAVNQECVIAIYGIVGGLKFQGIGYSNYYLALCQNPLKVISVYAIAKTYCSPNDLQPGYEYLNQACLTYAFAGLMPEAAVAANLTDEAIGRYPILSEADANPLKNLTTPVLISRDWFNLGFRTEDTWDYENRKHPIYGFAMYGFWGGVLLIGIIRRLISFIVESRSPPPSTGPEDTGTADSRENSAIRNWKFASLYSPIRKHLTTPSTIPPYRRQLLFGCTIPTRIESLVVFSYWILSLVLCCVNYRAFNGNLYWSNEAPQLWRYIADRTGIIAYSNLPLMWMFSGRNNIFIWLTGWPFPSFNIFHRHIARITTLQAIIHSIAYTAFYFTSDEASIYREQLHLSWFYLGFVATIAMSFIVFFSFSWFRRRLYDSFLLIHITLSIVLVITLFYHTSMFEGQYEPYLWPLVAIWSFDRFLRIVRVVYCNLHVSLSKKTLNRSAATIAYDQDANVIRVHINTHVKPRPGQHYFLYQPFRFTGWENHPFTLAHWSQKGQTGTTDTVSRAADESMTTSLESGQTHTVRADEYRLSFWVRPRDGWTRRLRDLCLKSQSPSQIFTISTETILLEGPYGVTKPLWTFDEVLLIAGGSGITAMVPYILDHVERVTATNKSSQTCIRSLTLVWADRNQAFIQRVAQRELAVALARHDISCMFYCTGRTDSTKLSMGALPSPSTDEIPMGDEPKVIAESSVFKGKEETDISEKKDDAYEAGSLAIRMGRPDIPAIIEKAVASATESRSRLAVMACGPAGMSDAARGATSRAIGPQIEYFEQAFGW